MVSEMSHLAWGFWRKRESHNNVGQLLQSGGPGGGAGSKWWALALALGQPVRQAKTWQPAPDHQDIYIQVKSSLKCGFGCQPLIFEFQILKSQIFFRNSE